MKQCKRCGCDEIIMEYDAHEGIPIGLMCVSCGSFALIEVEGDIREALKEALSDYMESCSRQCVVFNDIEAKRFIKESNMNLTDEEKEYIREMTE